MTKKATNWGGKRIGAGRPSSSPEPLTAITLRIPTKAALRFRQVAKARGISQTQLLREMIADLDTKRP